MGKRDNLILKLDEISCGLMNIKESLKYHIFSNKKLLKRNAKLKEDNLSKDVCFVIGNGPSLQNIDIKKIEKYPCFTVNLFFKSDIDFKTTYHAFVDHVYGTDDYYKYVMEVYQKIPTARIIVRDSIHDRIKQDGLDEERFYYIRPNYVHDGKKIDYDMTKCMTGSANVVPVTIACALSMGFKKIYLLGCDFNSYAVAKNEHFYDAKGYEEKAIRGNIVGDLIRSALVHKQHYALDSVSQQKGCKIYNLTEGSLIDAYERDTLEHVLEGLQSKEG